MGLGIPHLKIKIVLESSPHNVSRRIGRTIQRPPPYGATLLVVLILLTDVHYLSAGLMQLGAAQLDPTPVIIYNRFGLA